jgi:hypothetical protein
MLRRTLRRATEQMPDRAMFRAPLALYKRRPATIRRAGVDPLIRLDPTVRAPGAPAREPIIRPPGTANHHDIARLPMRAAVTGPRRMKTVAAAPRLRRADRRPMVLVREAAQEVAQAVALADRTSLEDIADRSVSMRLLLSVPPFTGAAFFETECQNATGCCNSLTMSPFGLIRNVAWTQVSVEGLVEEDSHEWSRSGASGSNFHSAPEI